MYLLKPMLCRFFIFNRLRIVANWLSYFPLRENNLIKRVEMSF